MSTTYIGLVKAEYEYAATTDEELSIAEDQVLYVLEDDDADWWKVRVKQSPSAGGSPADAPTGLVPATYVTKLAPVKQVTALYDYEATSDEEITITEDTVYDFYEDDGEWALLSARNKREVGYAPSSYLDLTGSAAATNGVNGHAEDTSIPAPPPPPPAAPPAPTPPPAPAAPPAPVVVGGAFKLPPPPRRMHSDSSLGSDDDGGLPGAAPAAIPAPPPPPPAPPAAPVPPPAPVAVQAPRSIPTPVAPPAPVQSSGKKAFAAYDFTAAGSDEISMTEGEPLWVINDSADDWWRVRNARGEEGEVPATYVELESGASGAADTSADEEAARRAAEEEKEERRKERERKRLKALEDEARGMTLPDILPPPPRRTTVSSGTSTPREAVRSPGPPVDAIPIPPPAPPMAPRAPSPPSPPPQNERESRKARHAQREQEREAERQRRHGRESGSSGQAQPVEKTKPSPTKVRTWRDRTGAFKVDAEFVGLSGAHGEKIRLHKLNGVVIEVPLEKMSAEDIRFLEHATKRRLGPRREEDRDSRRRDEDRDGRRDRDRDERHKARLPSETTSRRAAASSGKKPQTDWFEFFLNAGCDVDDCSRYANNFEKDRIDESILPDLEASTLRSLGLREGDMIRVGKYIKTKYGSSAVSGGGGSSSGFPSEAPRPPKKDDHQRQMEEDEELARKLQEELSAGRDGSGLFTTKEGGIKNTRRGRPTPKAAPSAQSFDSITSSLTSDRGSTPETGRVLSPDTIKEASKRSSSTQPVASGFDDDAWTVKPSSKPSTPALVDTTDSPAPAMPTSSKEASNAQALTDAYLESIGLGKNSRPSSAPVNRQAGSSPAINVQIPQGGQPVQSQHSGYPASPAGYAASPVNGPRAPPAPIPLNQQLLNPLIPTSTGLTGFVPTRSASAQSPISPMMAQPTGYLPPPAGLLPPQQTGFQPQPTGFQPQQTGFQPQPTGFQPQPTGFQPQPTGFQSPIQPPQYGGMQPQPTGYLNNQMSQMSLQPTGMYAPPAPQAPPPPPMPMQQQQQPQQSSSAAETAPSNIFAQMRAGQFAKPSDGQAQPEQKYDALRPQPTGFAPGGYMGQMGMQGMPPQPLQAQPTGFAPGGYMQPQMMYPQQTGYAYRQF